MHNRHHPQLQTVKLHRQSGGGRDAQQRLGDGFYEQKLIREQVGQLTGRRFLDGYANDEAQYQALMSAGVTYAQTYQLTPGVALSATQMAALTTDMVWLVEQTVTLPDGTVKSVLVPQVYGRLQAGDLQPSGALIAANDIQLNLTQDLNNLGTIAGRNIVQISANNLNNLGGNVAGKQVALTASQDLNNLGGSITAADRLSLNAGHDLNVTATTATGTSTSTSGSNSFSRTYVNRVAGLYVTNANGIMVASAGNDINLAAAVLQNNGQDGSITLNSTHNLNLNTVTTAQNDTLISDNRNHLIQTNTQDIGTQITSTGDIALKAGNDIQAIAAEVSSGSSVGSGGALNVTSGHDIKVGVGQNTLILDAAFYQKSHGFLSSRTLTTQDNRNDTTSVGGRLSGNTVTLNAGNAQVAGKGDINITGSNVVSDNGTTLNAKNNINIMSATDINDGFSQRQEKRSGLLSSGGIGFTIGSQKLTTSNDTQGNTSVASTIGSINGDVNINAGNHYQQTGSDVLAPKGDVNITAQDISIQAATDTNTRTDKLTFKQTGLTVSVNGGAISAAQNTLNEIKGAVHSTTAVGRLANLAALADDATAIKSGVKGIADGFAKGGVTGAVKDSGISLNISLGTSKSSSTSTQTNTNAASSHVAAGGDVNIKATGAGKLSDITVQGSEVSAKQNINLKADGAINLLAAQNTATLDSKNKSSSASIGASVGLSTSGVGLSVNASLSQSRGKANGNDVANINTHINAGKQLTLTSGGDTTLKGAVATGKQVMANIGGDLNLESLQDTSTYNSKQQSVGVGISVPIVGGGAIGGNLSLDQQKAKGNYASVIEQTAIIAGDNGFNITTKGNTDLAGAVISSTDKAVQDNKNSLTTDTLSYHNIQNTTEASASSDGINLNQDLLSKYGAVRIALSTAHQHINESENHSSVTQSAIEEAATNITTANTAQKNISEDNALTISRDTQNANQPLIKLDAKALEQQVKAEAQQRAADVQLVTRITDDAYRVMFRETPKFYKVTCPTGNCVENPKLAVITEVTGTPQEIQAQIGADKDPNKILAVNGIQNGIERAGQLAFQNTDNVNKTEQNPNGEKPSTVYFMHYQPANSSIGELIVAGYERVLNNAIPATANFLGYTNPDTTYAQTLQGFGTDPVTSLGHSRGGSVQLNALNILNSQGYTNENLSVRTVGGAVGVTQITGAAAQVVGQKHINQISTAYYANDPVAVMAGSNIGIATLRDLWTVLTGPSNTQHSCYGTGAQGCTQVEIPLPNGNLGTPAGNDLLIHYTGGVRDDQHSVLPDLKGSAK
jgi:filamentous hemagglutinin